MPATHATRDRTGRPGRAGRTWWPAARRAAAGAALAAAALGAGAAAGPAALAQRAGGGQVHARQARYGRLPSVVIESVTPRWAAPGHRVTVSGIVTNGSARALSGLSIQLRSSATPLGNRDELGLYATGRYPADLPEGLPLPLHGAIPAGGAVHWTAMLQPSAIGMTQFGVYPLAVQLLNASDLPVATDRTLLPFWAGGPAAQRPRPLRVGWVWPLIDRPYQAACPALLSDALAGSLAAGGRLGGLLAAGASYSAAARLTWAIDPALVQDAQTMTRDYTVSGNASCADARPMRASSTARAWLSGLTGAIAGQQVFFTPYADADVAALSHDGLDTDLADAFAQRAVATRILHLPSGTGGSTAWPDNGFADAGVLGSLTINGISTVLLDSTVMPPSTQLSYTPSATTTTAAAGTGVSLNVLLADHAITQILSAPDSAAPGAAFAAAQRFLAETAMIVAESPGLARSLVVAPPRRWAPPPGLAADLLSETVQAPWLRPATLADLAAGRHPSGAVQHRAPPNGPVTRGELDPSYLAQIKNLDTVIRLQASILTPAAPHYLDTAVAALESTAWRGRRQQAVRQELIDRVTDYVSRQGKRVSIIDRGRITLSGSTGKVPISITNRLPQAVRVRLGVHVPSDRRLTVTLPVGAVSIPAGKTMTIRLSVHASTVGVTDVTLGLLTPDGRPLPGTMVRLTVRATRFGTLALVIMCVALAVFVLTASARAIRRSRRDGRGGPGGEQHGEASPDQPVPAAETGSVGSGDDLAHDHPPEDPDEYADARGRASR